MAAYTFFTNPMSRGQMARWALHEVGADYEQVIVEYRQPKPEALLAANPMAKVPTLIHHTATGDYPIAETAAIIAYLADTEANAQFAPTAQERAAYYRWLLFAAGPVEQAITLRSFGYEPSPEQEGFAGFGNYQRTVDALAGHLAQHDYVCGARFTLADVYVGSQVTWGVAFKMLPDLPAFAAYAARLVSRPAYLEAKAIDEALIAQRAG